MNEARDRDECELGVTFTTNGAVSLWERRVGGSTATVGLAKSFVIAVDYYLPSG